MRESTRNVIRNCSTYWTNLLNFHGGGGGIACMNDGEHGTVSLILSLVDVCCWNHVFNNVKGFVTKNGGGKVYKDNIKTTLKAKDEQDMSRICHRLYGHRFYPF